MSATLLTRSIIWLGFCAYAAEAFATFYPGH